VVVNLVAAKHLLANGVIKPTTWRFKMEWLAGIGASIGGLFGLKKIWSTFSVLNKVKKVFKEGRGAYKEFKDVPKAVEDIVETCKTVLADKKITQEEAVASIETIYASIKEVEEFVNEAKDVWEVIREK
jgi:hypothetical protein